MSNVDLTKMGEPYSEEFRVLECECDFAGELTAGGLLRLVQQVGTDQCTALGMDDAFYRDEKAVFLLTRQAVQIYTPPRRGQIVRLQTIGQAPQRAVYKRVTKAFSPAGELLAMSDSRWMLVNTESRRIMRRPPEGFPAQWQANVPEELEQRIHAAERVQPAGEKCADYSSCDTNGHMNNTRYVDAACSALPLEVLRSARVAEVRIVYHREVPMGESVQMQRADQENGWWYVCAEREGHAAFECALQLQNRPEELG